MRKSGWYNESRRHSLASKGIESGRKSDAPEYGKIYALTSKSGEPSIASGNTWAESEVKRETINKNTYPEPKAEQPKDDLELKDLEQFSRSEEYHKINPFNPNQLGTDGIAYIMKNGYSWFVSDMAIAIGSNPKLKGQEFLSVKLKVNPDKTATATIDDGNGNVLYKQLYKYTDAKRDLKLFYRDNVMMLSGD